MTFKIDEETKKSEESDLGADSIIKGGTIASITLGTNKQTALEAGALLNRG